MPWPRPSLTDLRQQAMNDIAQAGLPGADGFLRRAVLRVLAWVQAGFAHLHYGYLDYIARQAVPWTATDEWLTGWMNLVGVFQKDASFAVLTGGFSGTANTTLPAGTTISRNDGFAYTTNADATADSTGAVTVTMTATQAGAAGNADPGTPLVLADPVPGINSSGSVLAQVIAGADQESQDDFRTRGLARYAETPQGGARTDYQQWAEQVPGVTRCWVNPRGMGAGTVVIYFMMDNAEAAHGGFPQGTNGVASAEDRDTPATGDQLTVANYIFDRQPVTALVYACAPVNAPVNVTINGMGTVSADMQAQIAAALAGVFMRKADALGGKIQPSEFSAAISAVPGVPDFTLVAPAAAVSAPLGSLPTLGIVTYT